MPLGTPYSKTQVFADGLDIVQSVTDPTTMVSLEVEFSAIANALANVPAIYTSGDLILQGGIDFNALYSITDLRNLNATRFYVDGYGATGDGSTDDSTAITAALDAAEAAGGGTVVFGPKTYAVGSSINTTLTEGIVLEGVWGSSTIHKVTGATDLFAVFSDEKLTFRDLTFTADAAETDGYFISPAHDDVVIEGCTFTGAGAMAGAIETDTTNGAARFKLIDTVVNGTYEGVVVSLPDITDAFITNLLIDVTGGTPTRILDITTYDNVVINGVTIKHTAGTSSSSVMRLVGTGLLTGSDIIVESSTGNVECLSMAGVQNATLSNLRLIRPTSGVTLPALDAGSVDECQLSNIYISAETGPAIDFASSTNSKVRGLHIDSDDTGTSVVVGDLTGCTGCSFSDITANIVDATGLDFDGCIDCSWNGVVLHRTGASGTGILLDFANVDSSVATGLEIEATAGPAFGMASADELALSSVRIFADAAATNIPFQASGATNCTVNGLTLVNDGTTDIIDLEGASNVQFCGVNIRVNSTNVNVQVVNVTDTVKCSFTGLDMRSVASANADLFDVDGADLFRVTGGTFSGFDGALSEMYVGAADGTLNAVFVGTITNGLTDVGTAAHNVIRDLTNNINTDF